MTDNSVLFRTQYLIPFARLSDTLRSFQSAHPGAYDIQGTFLSLGDANLNLVITWREKTLQKTWVEFIEIPTYISMADPITTAGG
jgi:hypothetical protein